MNEKLIIVGAGIAAINAIKAIREVDNDIKINIYGEEIILSVQPNQTF